MAPQPTKADDTDPPVVTTYLGWQTFYGSNGAYTALEEYYVISSVTYEIYLVGTSATFSSVSPGVVLTPIGVFQDLPAITPSSLVTSISSPVSMSSSVTTSEVGPISASSLTSTTNSTTSTPTPTSHKKVISAEAAAGIGIGSAIIGALLALLAGWICLGKRRSGKREGQRYSWTKVKTHTENEKGLGTRNAVTLENNLLERADDSDIRKSMQDLNEMIDQHCVNYYHLQTLNVNQGDLEHRLVECGYNSPNSSGPSVAEFAKLLQNPRTRTAAIHRFISLLVLSRSDWRSSSKVSLLPSQISNFCQSIPPVESYPGSEEVFEKAFTKWRHLSAFLLQPIRSSREALQANEQELQEAINGNIASINIVLNSFINPSLEDQRRRQDNLRAIIFAGAQIGLLLFSQPFEWQFSWQAASNRTEFVGGDKAGTQATSTEIRGQQDMLARTLVVFPAIREKIDGDGVRRIKVITEAVEVEV